MMYPFLLSFRESNLEGDHIVHGRLGQQPLFQYITVNSVDGKMEDGDELWIGDKLPTIYEVALTIFHYSKKITSVERKTVIYKYADAVRNMWI